MAVPPDAEGTEVQQQEELMIAEADVLRALDKPRKIYSIQCVVNPGQKSTDELHALLLKMRDNKKVAFDIKSGRWTKQPGRTS